VTRDTTWGLFAPTTFYDGQAMMVRQSVGASTLEDLAGATICVQSGTTTELNLTDRMRELGVEFTPQVYADIDQTYSAYEGERCDAVTSDRSQLVARRSEFANPDEHILLEEIMSKEPLGPVTPLGDDAWFNVVKWTVFATIEAEELGITQANVATEATSNQNPVVRRLLGAEGELGAQLGLENDWVVDVITAVGNYGEIFQRNLGPLELERGQNNLWNADPPGLLYAPPYR
jgi:general L-amino acid transport system substrate-binding protein